MDAIRLVRGIAANGPPYPDDAPRAVVDFLTMMSAEDGPPAEDTQSHCSEHSARYFLEAFEIFPGHPPSSNA
ncbi:hypothetical protein BD310DRAFT_771178, partial [Dichomitus squalens]